MSMHPNPELVAVEWIRSLDDIPIGAVATTLPSNSADFATNGFITVQAVAGVPDPDTFMQNSHVQVDTWAYSSNGSKPPWGQAATLAMNIKKGLENAPKLLDLGSNFNNARVHEVVVYVDPRRIPSEEGNFARYSFDLILHWTEVV